MSFGQPALRIREPFKTTSASQVVQRAAARRQIVVKGRWWLWLFLAQWRLTLRGEEEVRWTSRQRAKAEALRQLDGQKLMAVEVDSADGRTRFSFDLGAELEVWRLTRECVEDRLWSLYLPDGYVIAVRGDGAILRVAGSESGL